MLEEVFKIIFFFTVLFELVIVFILCVQVWRRRGNKEGKTPLIINIQDLLYGVVLFSSTMVLTILATDGWRELHYPNILLYATTFGIVVSAEESLRSKAASVPNQLIKTGVLFTIPLGFFAGIVNV